MHIGITQLAPEMNAYLCWFSGQCRAARSSRRPALVACMLRQIGASWCKDTDGLMCIRNAQLAP